MARGWRGKEGEWRMKRDRSGADRGCRGWPAFRGSIDLNRPNSFPMPHSCTSSKSSKSEKYVGKIQCGGSGVVFFFKKKQKNCGLPTAERAHALPANPPGLAFSAWLAQPCSAWLARLTLAKCVGNFNRLTDYLLDYLPKGYCFIPLLGLRLRAYI